MADQHVITTMGTSLKASVLTESTLQAFKARLRGALLQPGEAGYDEARKIWNGMIDRKPALVARCAGVADVIQAVTFACTHHLLVSVRGGSHNVPGNAVCEGGLMIDWSQMKSVHVDPIRRTARAEGGVTWGEFDHETQAFGLATTGGTDSTTGIAGLTLGGGLGWLAGKYGLACDNLLSVDIVTADGQFLMANATENADLFWGVRGGGGNFGVVTSFAYRLHPVGPVLYELMMLSMWLDPAEYEVNAGWTRRLAEAMGPFTTGRAYANQMGTEAEEGADRIKAAYGPNYDRLVALKNKYDPTNLFRHNQNLKPTV